MAVPTIAARDARGIDFERGMRITPVCMMPAKRTTPNTKGIERHIAPNDTVRVLLCTPCPYRERWLGNRWQRFGKRFLFVGWDAICLRSVCYFGSNRYTL